MFYFLSVWVIGMDFFHISDFSYNVGSPFQVVFRFVLLLRVIACVLLLCICVWVIGMDFFHISDFSYNVGSPFQIVSRYSYF